MSDTPAPPSRNGASARNGALLGVGLLIAAQVPMTIEKVPDPTVRSLLQLLAVFVVLGVGYLMTPTKR